MRPETIARRWQRAFGSVAPLGHSCMAALPSRWVRAHSLPGSQRYANTPGEYAELLLRYNTVATEVLGAGSECVLFVCEFPGETAPSLGALPPALSVAPIPMTGHLAPAESQESGRISAVSVTWSAGTFDDLLRARADDALGPILFANLDRRTAFAPYDGGSDLFLEDADAAARCRALWPAWLSSREDGL